MTTVEEQLTPVWTVAQTLGEGGFGDVKLIYNHIGEPIAMKIIDLSKHVAAADSVVKETRCLKLLNHKNIIRFIAQRKIGNIQYIFLEYAAGGELFDRIEPDVGMPENEARRLFLQLLSGVEYMHSLGIAHRDLKPENLLLDSKDDLKITDFGFATLFRHNGIERKLDRRCGTIQYVAPEVLSGAYHAQPADFWSCGIILVAMLSGELPWDQPCNACPAYRQWREQNSTLLSLSPWNHLPPFAFPLLRKILAHSPTRRMTIAQFHSHPWAKKKEIGLGPDVYGSEPKRLRGSGDGFACTQPDHHGQTISDIVELKRSNNGPRTFTSFSQPAALEDLLINSQGHTQTLTQGSNSTPLTNFQRLVKRMTRFIVKTDMKSTLYHLEKAARTMTCQVKQCDATDVITLSMRDKRKRPLSFKVTPLPLGPDEMLLDFRLSKGDGIEFKRAFLNLKKTLVDEDIIVQGLVTWPMAVATNTVPY